VPVTRKQVKRFTASITSGEFSERWFRGVKIAARFNQTFVQTIQASRGAFGNEDATFSSAEATL